jgi:glutamate N-acetyltransferase / amino-acid N-acetyltransferase
MSVTAAEGFVASGLHAGVKARKPDMALLATDDRQPVPCAAVFTQNLFCAPPVQLDRALLEANGGRAAAIIVNSGNANAGTGERGLEDARAMGSAAAAALGLDARDVLVCSTGIIGTPLPMPRILAAVPALAGRLSRDGGRAAAEGILTTDKTPKEVVIRSETWTLGGMAKGCGMIAPNMATMLAFLTTDAQVPREALQAMLKAASDRTFNTLNVDGATSTNDSAMLLARGGRGAAAELDGFARAVEQACRELTLQMARDAEGMTRIAHLAVTGAASDAEARQAAKAIAENNLVKCSWYGADPYWGRLLAAAGSAGVAMRVEKSAVLYGGIKVADGGVGIEHDGDALIEHMLGREFEIEVRLGVGSGEARMIGIDLGPGYIKENSVTS